MPVINLPDTETLTLGRNGSIGEMEIDWTKVPQHVLDHIGKVYKVQYFTDAANSGGKDATPAERLNLALKKRDQAYAGELRARGEASEPVDPVDAECWKMARSAMTDAYKSIGAWDVPKGTKDRFAFVVMRRRAERGLEELPPAEAVTDAIEIFLAAPANAHIRKAAERIVKERATAAKSVNLDELGI